MSQSRPNRNESVVTQEMLGLFVVVGADLILLVVLLAAVGEVGWTTAVGVTGTVLAAFGSWALLRWQRLRPTGTTDATATGKSAETPLETLKARYAAGELSEAEFERRVDDLMESDRRGESQQTETNQTDTEVIEERSR
jgi:uncharacterized membrane protein